ncbi:MAG: GNAT family N-acetyltransferase [Terracidiphilus sp.]
MSPVRAKFSIRRMTAADVDRVIEIALEQKEAPQWPPAAYLALLEAGSLPARIALVAEDTNAPSGSVLGFAIASVVAPEAELETIAVAALHQRRGVARRLFTALAAELSDAQVTDVHLEVRCSNLSALGLYHALGFSEAGRRPRYYSCPVEDALLLRLSLK